MSAAITITGDENIEAVFREMPRALTHKVFGQINYAAASPLIEKERLLAPEGPTGNLVDSIGARKISASKATEIGQVKVGPRIGGKYKGYAGHLVEYGTGSRKLKGNGKYPAGVSRGNMPSKPFAKPAFEATKGQVEKLIAQNTGVVLLRTMKRYIKKAGV